MKREAVLAEPFRQHLKDPQCVRVAGKAQHRIISKADQKGPASHPPSDISLEPPVQDFMQIDVGKER